MKSHSATEGLPTGECGPQCVPHPLGTVTNLAKGRNANCTWVTLGDLTLWGINQSPKNLGFPLQETTSDTEKKMVATWGWRGAGELLSHRPQAYWRRW